MILKKIVLSDRGALLIDTILSETDWEISLLIVDDFGHHKEHYEKNPRVKKILRMSDLIFWNGLCNIDSAIVGKYLYLFNIGDYGSRRLCDDFHFSHYQFYLGISYWEMFFRNNTVDACIITNTLHGFINDYILETISRDKGIPCYNVFYHFIDQFGIYNINTEKLCSISVDKRESIHLDKIVGYRNEFNYDKLKDVPYPQIAKLVYKIFGAKGIRIVSFLVRGKQPIHYRECTLAEYLKAYYKIKRMQKYVLSKYSEFDTHKKYVVYFLHYEPEAVITGNSPIIDSQLIHIKMLSDALPKGWILYVKEHPDLYEKFNSWELEYQIPILPTFYTKFFYDKLCSFKNVKLVHYKISASSMIKKAQAVPTIAGTVMSEAVLYEKAILCFAGRRHVYYYDENIFHIDSTADIQNAFQKIIAGYKPNYENIVNACSKYLFPANDAGKSRIITTINDILSQENIKTYD